MTTQAAPSPNKPTVTIPVLRLLAVFGAHIARAPDVVGANSIACLIRLRHGGQFGDAFEAKVITHGRKDRNIQVSTRTSSGRRITRPQADQHLGRQVLGVAGRASTELDPVAKTTRAGT